MIGGSRRFKWNADGSKLYMYVKCRVAVASGDIVVLDGDYTDDWQVEKTTTADSPLAIGVAICSVAAGEHGYIQVFGIATAKVDGSGSSISAGDPIGTSTTSGKADGGYGVGICLEAVSTDTTASIFVNAINLLGGVTS